MIIVRVGSVGTALSSSSLSLPASVDTFSAVAHLRAPQLVSRSPSLLKASQGVAEAAAIRGAASPCAFTLRGKQQTRENAVQHKGGGCSGAAASASSSSSGSPRRPPYRVDIGQGYSPRLRMMGRQEIMPGHKTANAATKPLSPTSRPGVTSSACGVAASMERNAVASHHRASHHCQDMSTALERGLRIDFAAETNETAASSARCEQGESPGPPPCARERPMTTSRADLCGRLWTGTTAIPQPNAGRSRVLFLVSGQQQPLKSPARTPCGERRRQPHSIRGDPVVIPLPPPAKAGIMSRVAAQPRGRKEKTASTGWRWRRASRGDVRAGVGRESENQGREGEATGDKELSPEGRCGVEADADEERYDAPTTAATDGKGDDSAKRVLHVRVPHPPPTSLLVLRSAPSATS